MTQGWLRKNNQRGAGGVLNCRKSYFLCSSLKRKNESFQKVTRKYTAAKILIQAASFETYVNQCEILYSVLAPSKHAKHIYVIYIYVIIVILYLCYYSQKVVVMLGTK